jgi:ribosomal protein S18 acetylase RimI-like enzyme
VEGSGNWIGFQTGNVLPDWRHKGIGNKLFDFNESRFKRIVTQLKESRQIAVDTECLLDNYVSESDIDRKNILEYRGYTPARYTFEMVRPNLDDIPDLPLPPGIEVRQVKNEHMKQIWEASNDAFRDHWGYIPDPWEEFSRFMNDADYDPTLLRVAWQGEQVAGMVLSFIDKEQNDIYHRKRGYTENICVRRPWRKHGLAKALIALSLKALKERGMTEAGLGVDAENTSGALNLYKSMGYQVVKSGTIYRKPLED